MRRVIVVSIATHRQTIRVYLIVAQYKNACKHGIIHRILFLQTTKIHGMCTHMYRIVKKKSSRSGSTNYNLKQSRTHVKYKISFIKI